MFLTLNLINKNIKSHKINLGLPHTQETQGIFKLKKSQGNSGNFDLNFILRETQGSFKFFIKNSG